MKGRQCRRSLNHTCRRLTRSGHDSAAAPHTAVLRLSFECTVGEEHSDCFHQRWADVWRRVPPLVAENWSFSGSSVPHTSTQESVASEHRDRRPRHRVYRWSAIVRDMQLHIRATFRDLYVVYFETAFSSARGMADG